MNIWNIIFHELAGINVIYLYSNTLLKRVLAPGSFFTPRTGTYIISIVNLGSYIMATWTVSSFGRRPLLFWGHVGISIAHALIGVFILTGFDIGIVIMMCVFIWMYANTTGPIAWVYLAETCTDIGLGVGLLTLWAVVLIEVLFVPTLMNSSIETSGVFFLFAAFSAVAAVFIYVFLKETRGLSDKEKRTLYSTSQTVKLSPTLQLSDQYTI